MISHLRRNLSILSAWNVLIFADVIYKENNSILFNVLRKIMAIQVHFAEYNIYSFRLFKKG